MHVFWHDDVLGHDTGRGQWEAEGSDELFATLELHPENALRVENMRAVLQRGPIAPQLCWRAGRHATKDELTTVHDPAYVDEIQRRTAAPTPSRWEDGNTVLGPGTWAAALAAAGTSLRAVDAVLDGETSTAYALVRPPGHHAQPAQADGYCLFNNAALAAQRARDRGLQRVAIVDWDVHHGNGNQACFYDRSDVLTVSLHMQTGLWGPTHPQTGGPAEVGHGDGQGFNVNVELPLGSGDQAYEASFRQVVLPILRQFGPDLIVASVGQDASTFDANGRQSVSMDGFRALGRLLGRAARELCHGRLVMVQEGGYARTYAALCLHATLEGVLDLPAPLLDDPLAYIADDYSRARTAVESVQSALSRYWNLPLIGGSNTELTT